MTAMEFCQAVLQSEEYVPTNRMSARGWIDVRRALDVLNNPGVLGDVFNYFSPTLLPVTRQRRARVLMRYLKMDML